MYKRSNPENGFTLVEMLVIAPIVILAITSFIGLLVSLSGEVLVSRESNQMVYDVNNAIDTIERDVSRSEGFLAQNSITFSSSNPQGYGLDSTVNFDNTGNGNGDVLILKVPATNANPASDSYGLIYIDDAPNDCTADYTSNDKLYINIIYFVDDDGTLWRRTVLPADYASASYCGGTVWQLPSCATGYTSTFCKTNDEKVLEDVSEDTFGMSYYYRGSYGTSVSVVDSSANTVTDRNINFLNINTVSMTLSIERRVAGEQVDYSGDLFAEVSNDGGDVPDISNLRGLNETNNTTLSTSSLSGSSGITMYAVFDIFGTAASYNVISGLSVASSTNRFQLDTAASGNTGLRYRIDTTTASNSTSTQGEARTVGRHIGWLQVSSSGATRSFGYDKSTAHNSSSLTGGSSLTFTGLSLPAKGAYTAPIATMVYSTAHDEATRAEVMSWLSDRYSVHD